MLIFTPCSTVFTENGGNGKVRSPQLASLENTATGAAKRALELHRRLAESFDLRAAVTSGFPVGAAPGVPKVVFSPARTPLYGFPRDLPVSG